MITFFLLYPTLTTKVLEDERLKVYDEREGWQSLTTSEGNLL